MGGYIGKGQPVSIDDNTVETVDIQDDAVTNAKIATNAVTGDSIAANAVGNSEMSDNAVGTAEIADDAVTADKLANAINTDIATGVTGNTTANAALPKAGGAISGNLSFSNSSQLSFGRTAGVASLNFEDASDAAIFVTAAQTTNYFQPLIGVGEGSGTFTAAISSVDNGSGAAQGLVFHTGDTNAITERLRIDSSGNVGINTTTASTNLQVKADSNSTTDYPITVLNSAESVTTGYGAYGIDQSASSAYTIDVHDDFVIKNNQGEQVRVLENGNTGIGTSSPASPLHVAGNMQVNTTTNDNNELRFKVTAGGAGDNCTVALYQDNGSTAGVFMQADGASWFTGGINPSSGNTTAANVLDDYEEGVHQFTITGSTSGSMTVRSGYNYFAYTKIGRVVHVQGRWETAGTHNAVGSLKFSLPFAAANLTEQSGVGGGFISLYRTATIFNGLEARIYEGNSFFHIFYQHATLDDEVVTGGDVDSSIEGIINFSYIAA